MTEHLGYDKHDPAGRDGGNSRNGTRTKTVISDAMGDVTIDDDAPHQRRSNDATRTQHRPSTSTPGRHDRSLRRDEAGEPPGAGPESRLGQAEPLSSVRVVTDTRRPSISISMSWTVE